MMNDIQFVILLCCLVVSVIADTTNTDVDISSEVARDKQELPNVQQSSSKELELPCSHPGNIDHGLTDWNGTGSVAKFACYQGYYLVGPPKLICRYGRWFSDAPADRPSCKPVVCSQPSVSQVVLAPGDTVRYKAGG